MLVMALDSPPPSRPSLLVRSHLQEVMEVGSDHFQGGHFRRCAAALEGGGPSSREVLGGVWALCHQLVFQFSSFCVPKSFFGIIV